MIYIAHRALFAGPNPDRENHPEQILAALDAGFDVEVDVWRIDRGWFLGHDAPVHKIDRQFLARTGLWIHCKNLEALAHANKLDTPGGAQYFWHQEDSFTLTSHKVIWTYPGQALMPNSVWVQPEWHDGWRRQVRQGDCHGICSKHVAEIKHLRNDRLDA